MTPDCFELSWYLEGLGSKYVRNGCTFKEVFVNVYFEMWERWTRFWRISFQIGCHHYLANNDSPLFTLIYGLATIGVLFPCRWALGYIYIHISCNFFEAHLWPSVAQQIEGPLVVGNEFHHHELVRKALRFIGENKILKLPWFDIDEPRKKKLVV